MPTNNSEVVQLSPAVANQVKEYGLQIAELSVTKLSAGWLSPYAVRFGNTGNYYHAVAVSQGAIMQVLRGESDQRWDFSTLQPSILEHWGEHRDKRLNRKIQKGHNRYLQGFANTQREILKTGLSDLLSNRILHISFEGIEDLEEFEIDPMAADFDPLSGEAVNHRRR